MSAPRFGPAARWTVVCAIVVVALAVAIWPRQQSAPAPDEGAQASSSASPEQLAASRAKAALPSCDPVDPAARPAGPMAGLTVTCMGDGRPVDVGRMLAGKPALLNIWAYWCGPCRVELPALAEAAKRAAGRVTLLTVHADPAEAAGLDLLAELGVHLPGVQDSEGRVGVAAEAPRVYPATILLRADGSVAGVHASPFTSADDVAQVVRDTLGVTI